MKVTFLFLTAVFLTFNACQTKKSSQDKEIPFTKHGELAFIKNNTSDTITTIDFELAGTERKRDLGLMYRHSLKTNHGMLFPFENEQPRSFWMRNTFLSLDIIYVDANFHIVSISDNTEPMSDLPVLSNVPAQYVVEVNAGFCLNNGIKPGDAISYTSCIPK
ncbi:DUF192 domain-containing protein [Carboxylicivirga sp. N1Y90]|uniref:DUF192 domain-containing protein n=1 Tax=Carboxylicivirga fragile TaxID=3417571 RepID=UPI003D339D50|nr:DUF192 domain-containing protein [Marinilabiliaceae bacterium N1Y90]